MKMLKGLSLIALVMVISADARNLRPNDVSIEAEPYTVVFQFYNNANQDAELFSFAHIPGSNWSEAGNVEVAGYGGFLQRQLTGPDDGTEGGGMFQIQYATRDRFFALATIGGEEPLCIADVMIGENYYVDISSEYDITDRTLTCIVTAADQYKQTV